MWRNPSNNYEEYFRDHQLRESSQWSQTHMGTTGIDRSREGGSSGIGRSTSPEQHHNWIDRDRAIWSSQIEWDRPIQPNVETNSESFGNNAFYQPQLYSQHQHEEMGYEWSDEQQYYHSYEAMGYMENHEYQQEPFNPNLYYHDNGDENHQEDEEPENPETISMLQQILEGQERGVKEVKEEIEETKAHLEKVYNEISERLDQITLQCDSLKAKVEILEASNNEDMVQESGVWNAKDYIQQQYLYEDDDESIQFQEDESNEDVQDAHIPLKEEIEETPNDAEMTEEGEVVEVFFPYYEIVVEHQDDHINTQQQSPAGDEVEEFIRLHEIAPDEDALALIVAVMNEETLRLNEASTKYATYKEEEEVVQIFELPQKELHQDEAVEPRVPGTPTPRMKHPQGPRKRLEWKIKHKWRIKPRNV